MGSSVVAIVTSIRGMILYITRQIPFLGYTLPLGAPDVPVSRKEELSTAVVALRAIIPIHWVLI